MGCYQISLGDTIGSGTPRLTREIIARALDALPVDAVAMHMHDTRGTALAGKFGGRPRVGFCNWELWTSLINELGSKVMYGQVDAYERADIGFQSVKVHGGREPVEIVPDVNCPAGRIYLLDESSWGLYSADGDEVIQIVREDGLTMLRSTGADAFDMRLASELEIGCNAPGKNCVIKVN